MQLQEEQEGMWEVCTLYLWEVVHILGFVHIVFTGGVHIVGGA